MLKAVIIVGSGFEDSEFIYPFYRLQEANFRVDVVTHNGKIVSGKHGTTATPTVMVETLDPQQWDLVVIPGGHEGPDRVRQVAAVLKFVKSMDEAKKPIASICHGPWVLVSAGVLRGKNATCYKGCKDDISNAGANYLDQPVVVDGHLVTAQHFRDNPAWMKATLQLFKL